MKSEDAKSINTWGIPNNLFRTMAWHPRLALTEVDYANSFIFDEDSYASWPAFNGSSKPVLFPQAGFVDRVTKELVINLVSLLNRSRYSITHHTVIAYSYLQGVLGPAKAESLLLNLVDGAGRPAFDNKSIAGLYSSLHIHALWLAVKLRDDAHQVTDSEFLQLRAALTVDAKSRLTSGLLASEPASQSSAYLEAFVNAMLIELTWCTVHFAGLLNKWFTVLRVADEDYPVTPDGKTFVQVYNAVVPESIKVRNNALLGIDGWG